MIRDAVRSTDQDATTLDATFLVPGAANIGCTSLRVTHDAVRRSAMFVSGMQRYLGSPSSGSATRYLLGGDLASTMVGLGFSQLARHYAKHVVVAMDNATLSVASPGWTDSSPVMQGLRSANLDHNVAVHLFELIRGNPEVSLAIDWLSRRSQESQDFEIAGFRREDPDGETQLVLVDVLISQDADRDWYDFSMRLEDELIGAYPGIDKFLTVVPWPKRIDG